MKIVLLNYHYFIHGGPDRYFFNIKNLLEREGHTVIPFSFNYEETYDTPYGEFFPDPISGKGTFLLENLQMSKFRKLLYVKKMFFNRQVEKKFIDLLSKEKPDIVYSIYLSSSMLPKILYIAKTLFDIPVIYRLSDFHMFCPSYLFFRDGSVCQDCLTNSFAAVKNKCVQGSMAASMLRVLQITYIRWNKWYDKIDRFICPSRLMEKTLLQAGFPREKVLHVPTFSADLQGDSANKDPYILYYGKLIREKGVEVLIDAYNKIKTPLIPLRLIGPCSDSYRKYLFSLVDHGKRKMVSILPPLQGEVMWQAVRDSAFVVQPAIWLENMPNTLVEALSAGKPVIASDIGSLTELVSHGENGYLVSPGDVNSLAIAIEKMSTLGDLSVMGAQARSRYELVHKADHHLRKLIITFKELIVS
ncbi:MAG: glycosyltransferase family 4 protein [Thiomonas sp.]|uniref:glycosyltransferase family 4 protein n=1 Tax=Thiomonas sp. TaxID=2047785 RepID=UPI002A371EA1|nr:glycosyltransferase family 4 protein [Thiomonas sp.]MDY0331760.1 glycosyltransferase family 4 protein [Thiomonas sp.]